MTGLGASFKSRAQSKGGRESSTTLANIAPDTSDLFCLHIGQPVTASVLPLHFEQDFSGVFLALFGPVADALHQSF